MKRRIYVQLGRFGDVFNVLPLLAADFARTGEKPFLMVAAEFVSAIDGVGYAEPIVWKGKFEDVGGAMHFASTLAMKEGLSVICTQIYGVGLASAEDCFSFMRESWARVPGAPAWGSLPLVFDRRDAAREQMVRETLVRGGSRLPRVVLALSGTSSPFEHAAEFKRRLRDGLFGEFEIVDVSGFAAPRIFDLLGVIEGAHCVVTIDSSVLHLAHAAPHVPVVAFVTREPSKWHGSPWRPQQIARYYYDEAPDCFAQAIDKVATPTRSERIVHVYTHIARGASDDATRRNDFAASTWAPEYATGRWIPRSFGDGEMARSSGDAPINDERPIPFMHDVINHALQPGWEPEDVVAWTNADSCFVPGITGLILDAVARHGAAYTHRWDFHRPLSVALPNEAAIRRGEWYPGTDACFFTMEWWMEHRDEYPDMLVGREQNDEVLRQLIKLHGGVELPAAIYHEKHPSFWEHHGRRMNGLGNQWNQRLAKKWFTKTGLRPLDPIWWQLEPERAQMEWSKKHLSQFGPRGILTR